MLKLKKINENEYLPILKDKEFHYIEFISKSVEIDGEIYTKSSGESKYFDSEADFNASPNKQIDKLYEDYVSYKKGRWYTRVYDMLVPFGYPIIYVWDYKGFDTLYKYNIPIYSQNNEANILCNFEYFNIIGKGKINYITTGRDEIYKHGLIDNIIANNSVFLPVMYYGSYHCVYVAYDLMSFIKSDFNLFYESDMGDNYKKLFQILNECNKSLFPKKLFTNELSDIHLNNIAMYALNCKINHKLKIF